MMKKILMRVRRWIFFQRESYLDGARFLRSTTWAGRIPRHSLFQLESEIVRRYHVVEKGLSMPDFRPRFGKETVRELVAFLAEWDHMTCAGGGDHGQIDAARSTIECYRKRHRELGVDVDDLFIGWNRIPLGCGDSGGVKPYRPVDLAAAPHFDEIVRSRVSVRTFDTRKAIEQEMLIRAVSQAICAPSVCNRQTWRVHQYDGDQAQRVLGLQSGNRGFGHTIPCVLVITSDLRYFTGAAERYQAWIDGGMFSMLLLLALHAQGLGAVALNWSVLNDRDNRIRKIGDIPDHERIIMLIGCGHPADGILVPKSHRRSPESILTRHS